jgi:hypothetical protein
MERKYFTALLAAICILFIAALIVLPSAPVKAAELEPYGFGGISLGAFWLDISELNRTLSANGFATFKKPAYSLGFESYYAFNGRVLFGGELQFFWQEATNTAYVQKLNSYSGFLNAGYSFFSRSAQGFHLYPLVGLGLSRMGLRLSERSVLDFSNIVSDPRRESSLRKWDFLIQTALGLDYTIGFKRSRDDAEGGVLIGMRLGYVYSVTDSRWKMSELDVSGAPNVSMSGFYVHFVIGGLSGGFSRYDRTDERED